jgi:hypothetical protein
MHSAWAKLHCMGPNCILKSLGRGSANPPQAQLQVPSLIADCPLWAFSLHYNKCSSLWASWRMSALVATSLLKQDCPAVLSSHGGCLYCLLRCTLQPLFPPGCSDTSSTSRCCHAQPLCSLIVFMDSLRCRVYGIFATAYHGMYR